MLLILQWIIQFGLLAWYIVAPVLFTIEYMKHQITKEVYIQFWVIEILTLIYICLTLFTEYRGIAYFAIAGVSVAWYARATMIDWNNLEYTLIQRIVYLGVDIATLLFIFTSAVLALTMKYSLIYNVPNQIDKLKTVGFSWF